MLQLTQPQSTIDDELRVLAELFPLDLAERIERVCVAIEEGAISGRHIYEKEGDDKLRRGLYSYLIDLPHPHEDPRDVAHRTMALIWKVGKTIGLNGTTPIERILFWADVRAGHTLRYSEALRTIYEKLSPLRLIHLLTLDELIMLCKKQSLETVFATAGSWGRDPLSRLHNLFYHAHCLEWYFPTWYYPGISLHAVCYSSLIQEQHSSAERLRGRFDLIGMVHQQIIDLIDQRFLGTRNVYGMTYQTFLELLEEVRGVKKESTMQ